MILKLYCNHPVLKRETPANLMISADSLVGALRQLLSEVREAKNHKDPYVANKASSILKYWNLDKAVEGSKEGAAKSAGTAGGKPVDPVVNAVGAKQALGSKLSVPADKPQSKVRKEEKM